MTTADKSAELVARLERLPFSRWHRNPFVLCILGVMFDACDFALFGMALPPVAREFGLDQAQVRLVGIETKGKVLEQIAAGEARA